VIETVLRSKTLLPVLDYVVWMVSMHDSTDRSTGPIISGKKQKKEGFAGDCGNVADRSIEPKEPEKPERK
jgi:hypothetical protein